MFGKKSFIYLTKLSDRNTIDYFGTDIPVHHVFHELGHAWHSEKDPYTMINENTYVERAGAASITYSLTKNSDKTISQKELSVKDLFIEEAMNTIDEEKYLAKYIGKSRNDTKKDYSKYHISSNYQGFVTEYLDLLLDTTSSREDFEKMRMSGNRDYLEKFNTLFEAGDYYKIINTPERLDSLNKNIRNVISRVDKSKVNDFFSENHDTYFPDHSSMQPIDVFDNLLKQFYDFTNSPVKYSFDMTKQEDRDSYKKIIDIFRVKNNYFLNSCKEPKKKYTKPEFENLTKETKNYSQIMNNLKENEQDTLQK
ncbi:MAG: hypothetical protein IKG42_05135 [Clostridia bacterium]|nr:hypothetical protein [Clostridia bacterium]